MKMYRFPTDPSRRDAWVRAIRRENWTPSEHSRICKLHFISEKPSPFPNNPDYVPSKFSFTVSTSSRQRDKINRYERLQARRRKRQSEPSLPRIESTEEVEVDSNVPEREQPEDTDESNTQFGLPQVTERGELHHVEHLMEANQRVVTLEDELKVAKEVISTMEAKYKEAVDKLHILEEEKRLLAEEKCMLEQLNFCTKTKLEEAEGNLLKSREDKVLLMKQLYQASSIALRIRNNDKKTHFFTGLPSYSVFTVLLTHLSPSVSKEKSLGSGLTLADEMLIVLMKISRGSTNKLIAFLFDVDESKVTKIFHRWIDIMFQSLQPLVMWPDKEMLVANMPSCFKPRYAKVVCIIDCTEVFIQRPTSLTARGQTYSNYKNHNTIKFLVATTPTGAVSFISKCWGGRVSDRHLTVSSGLLRHLKYGDLVLADRGFDIIDDLAMVGASLAIPPFTRGKPQLSQREVEFSRQLSNIRIHVERAIGRMKTYKILNSMLPIRLIKQDHETECTIDKIVFVCAALCNLHPPLVI